MQVAVKKFLFIGTESCKKHFFAAAQKLGQIEFIDSKEKHFTKKPEPVQRLIRAIKLVLELPTLDQAVEKDLPNSYNKLSKDIIQLHDRLECLQEEERLLKLEISRIEAFGHFSLSDLEYLKQHGKRFVQFFSVRKGSFATSKETPEIFFVKSAHGMDYFVAINSEEKSYQGLSEMKIERSLGDLKERLQIVSRSITSTDRALKKYAKYNDFLHDALINEVNKHNLDKTRDDVDELIDNTIFSIEGWVAKRKISLLKSLTEKYAVYVSEIAVEKKDKPPTCLSNKGISRIGEDLVNIYDTPSSSDMDTSPFVLWVFAFFFAMIMRDGGYGLIFLAAALFMRYKFTKIKGLKKRMVNLVLILSTFCIIWGGVTNSFFGIQFAPDSIVRKVSILQYLAEKKAAYHIEKKDATYQKLLAKYPDLQKVKNEKEFLNNAVTIKNGKKYYVILEKFFDSIRIEIALLIGVLHIAFAFLLRLRRNWAGIGWILFMVGSYLYFSTEALHATSILNFACGISESTGPHEGQILMYTGIGLAVLLALLQKGINGATEITKVIQVFSDVLSYLRIYALGLAGGMMSATFNEMGQSTGIVLGIVIIILGHAVNIALSIMGGVIHGLRLNFLEWYRHCFEGGGKNFNPLRLMTKD